MTIIRRALESRDLGASFELYRNIFRQKLTAVLPLERCNTAKNGHFRLLSPPTKDHKNALFLASCFFQTHVYGPLFVIERSNIAQKMRKGLNLTAHIDRERENNSNILYFMHKSACLVSNTTNSNEFLENQRFPNQKQPENDILKTKHTSLCMY